MPHSPLLVEKRRDALKQRLATLGERVELALRRSLDALRRRDLALAREIVAGDAAINRVDTLQREAIDAIVELIRDNPQEAAAGVALTWIAHIYERVADRATNIAERVVYIATGETPDLD